MQRFGFVVFAAILLGVSACSGSHQSSLTPTAMGAAPRRVQGLLPPSCSTNDITTPSQFSALTTYLQSQVAPSGAEQGLGFIVVQVPSPAPSSSPGPVQVVYENALGTYNTCTNKAIASASKMPSVLAILSLVNSGQLNLDAPISNYVPALFPNGTTITMRMLLSHTSGINNCGTQVCQPGTDTDVLGAPCRQDYYDSMQSCAQEIVGLPASFAPGTQFDYGGDDYQLAGYIAEVISGEAWTQFFQNTIGTPCGLTATTYGNPGYPTESNPWVAGAIYTTIEDYAKIAAVNLTGGTCNGTTIVTPALLTAMQNDYSQGLPVFYAAYPNHDYGMSWWHVSAPTGNNPTVVQDWGLWGATPWLDTACNTVAFLLIDDTGGGANKGLTIMNNIINNALITGPLGCPTQSASGTTGA